MSRETEVSTAGEGTSQPEAEGLRRLSVASEYVLDEKLGEGGMGSVFAARHRALGRRVAVKLLHTSLLDRDHVRERFLREAKLLAQLQSEHIVAVTDYGTGSSGAPFFVMEYLEGQDLRALLKEGGALGVGRAIQLGLDVCEGLQVVHEEGLIHRDLKPENLFVVQRPGGVECVKLLDFGVAKDTHATTFTEEGTLLGSVGYMAPEQIRGDLPLDSRVDIFALGAILYECLAGKPPFQGDGRDAVLFNILHQDPVPLSSVAPGLPAALERIVERALQRDRDLRFPEVGELLHALQYVRQRSGPEVSSSTPAPTDATPAAGSRDTSPAALGPTVAEIPHEETATPREAPMHDDEGVAASSPRSRAVSGYGVRAALLGVAVSLVALVVWRVALPSGARPSTPTASPPLAAPEEAPALPGPAPVETRAGERASPPAQAPSEAEPSNFAQAPSEAKPPGSAQPSNPAQPPRSAQPSNPAQPAPEAKSSPRAKRQAPPRRSRDTLKSSARRKRPSTPPPSPLRFDPNPYSAD